jgi:hypothetical protein
VTTASAWVRADRPGTTVEIVVTELRDGRPFATDTAGITVGTHWRPIEVSHLTHRAGSKLVVELAGDGAGFTADQVAVRTTE